MRWCFVRVYAIKIAPALLWKICVLFVALAVCSSPVSRVYIDEAQHFSRVAELTENAARHENTINL